MSHAPSHRAHPLPWPELAAAPSASFVARPRRGSRALSCVLLAAALATLALGAPAAARAQVVVDATIVSMTALTGPAFAVDETHGAVVGNTLYLSFGSLNIGAAESLVIDGPATVEHVVVRVTGGSATQLDGPVTLAIAGASLILTNPAGVSVGAAGVFTVPSDLVLTTADYVRASSGDRFQVPPFPSEVLPDTPPAHLGFLSGALGALTYDGAPLTLTGDVRMVSGDVTVDDAAITANHAAFIATNVGEVALATLDVSSMAAPAGLVRLTGVTLTTAMPAVVRPAGCGNGFVEPGEDCDDGDDMSATTPDACRPGCVAPSCGDGIHDSTEDCDLGAANSDTAVDGCRTNCEQAGCGDGVRDTGEVCDMGAMNSDTTPGACRRDCTFAMCGDGVRVAGEQCDDGDDNSDTAADACRTDCKRASCGDGVPDSGEECDDGPNNSSGAPDACRDDCLLPRCGDRVVDTGEVCDDGPFNSDDEPMRCRVDCQSANGPLDLHGGACDVPTQGRSEWPLGAFVLVAVAVLVPLRRRGL